MVLFDKLRDATILMLQWAIWKHLGPRIIMDGEKFQRLAENLASELYDEGVRMPYDDDEHETPTQLTADILNASREITSPPHTLPKQVLRERARKVAAVLYKQGWRKYATAALLVVEFYPS